MDEESLASYTIGGMDYSGIEDFDTWLAKPKNLSRLLPFSRCIVAFRVRRKHKARECNTYGDCIRIVGEMQADESTFLYMRNGEQLYRLKTGVEFEEKLFPDMGRQVLAGKLWANMRYEGRVEGLISDNEYQGMLVEEARQRAEAEAKRAALPKGERWRVSDYHDYFRDTSNFKPFTHDCVYYDDIAKYVQSEIDKHNRIALIIQGLLDRSPVFSPHPSWSIWTEGGFEQALELVYDESRALVAGEKPDFEAYRAKLNASLKVGSVTVGQELAWELAEGEKESERRRNDHRNQGRHYEPERYRPYGNPGPGRLAKISHFTPRTKLATYTWMRKRQTVSDLRYGEPVATKFTTPATNLLNVDAYKPGDFRIFFNDPRTRMEYLQWAPLLLEAEEYRKVGATK